PLEFVRLLDGHPRHPPAFGGQRVAGPHEGLLLHEHLLARSLPGLRRHDRRRVHSESILMLHVSRFVPVHVSLLFLLVLALLAARPLRRHAGGQPPSLRRCSTNGRLALAVLVATAPPDALLVAALGGARGRATGTCPRGRPAHAHRWNRCGRRRRPPARTRSCPAARACMWPHRFR